MVKIIFCDMDGTLLTSENKLPEGFDEMIAELNRRGVLFVPASGRQYFSLLRSFEKYRDEFLFLAENGAFVKYKDEEIFSSPLDKDMTREVWAVGEQLDNVMRVYCGKKDAYVLREQDKPELRTELDKYYTRNAFVDSFDEIDDTPLKISFFDPTGNTDKNVYPKLEHFGDKLQVVLSSNNWVDVMALNVNKGVAVKNIQRVMNFKPEECAAFGDYLNDCEMLEAVGYGFAMANAHPDLKEIAKFETKSNNQDGVFVGIRRLIAYGLI
ncbi:MAG: Cof-type HAD-IIB family hydrolase [Selenomonadaceae bacterium]|nr:Cof-type HAD-IIB family hydrolase [Selenomonadaceae bacterium]